MLPSVKKELTHVLSLSVCFMLLFAADNAMVNMQKTVVSSIEDEKPEFRVEGYTVTGFIYSLFAISLWFGPYINYAVGPRLTMVVSAIGYLCYVGSYAVEEVWAVYAGAICVGVAAGTLWPAQGHYLIGNSSRQTTARNVGIFWFIFMSSSILGNVFVYFTFHGKKYIDQSTRRLTIYILVAINVIAILAFMVLPKSSGSSEVKDYGPIKTIKKSWSILTTPKMMWLSVTFCYAGLQQSFGNGIYSPSIGFTLAFGDSTKELVALSGIFLSVGSLIGAFCPVVLSDVIRRHSWTRRMIVLAGCGAQLFAYLIAYVNLPDNAVFGNTEEQSLIHPKPWLAMLGSVLLGFGDSCLSTQAYTIIADSYRDSGAEGVALYKFIKGVLVAVSFYWCSHLGLHTQLAIVAVMAVVGVTAFFIADRDSSSQPTDNDNSTKVTNICKISDSIKY